MRVTTTSVARIDSQVRGPSESTPPGQSDLQGLGEPDHRIVGTATGHHPHLPPAVVGDVRAGQQQQSAADTGDPAAVAAQATRKSTTPAPKPIIEVKVPVNALARRLCLIRGRRNAATVVPVKSRTVSDDEALAAWLVSAEHPATSRPPADHQQTTELRKNRD